MKTRLSHKIFGTLLVTSAAILGLHAASHFVGHRNFIDYVNKLELERLSELSEMLLEEYENAGGWSRLRSDPRRWRSMVRVVGHGHSQPDGKPLEVFGKFQRRDRNVPTDRQGLLLSSRFSKGPFVEMHPRVFLLDEQWGVVAGYRGPYEGAALQELTLEDGRSIGWLGVSSLEPRLTPLEEGFLEKQKNFLYLVGACILTLIVSMSFLLSRHLLTPIRQLAEGTRALASRNLTTRISVRSGDELGELAADFNSMAQTLEQYEEMRKQWISDIAHELRTPLSILRGEIEAMLDGVRPVTSQGLESLHHEVVHIGKIVDDLHGLTMADSGALNPVLRPLDPVAVLSNSIKLYHSRFEMNQISMVEDLPVMGSVTVLGDADRLGQLYGNLLENTLRYADRPGTLIISGRFEADGFSLTFEDSGPGVPDEALGRLFDRLYRVDSARSRNQGGSGLGLAICKAIAESHGGSISAARGSSGGLKITVTLPVIEAKVQKGAGFIHDGHHPDCGR